MKDENSETLAPVRMWLAEPMEAAARDAVERVRRADDVVRVAVMPDVHAAGDVAVGLAIATRRLLYPTAVGGDIGCGMLAIAFDSSAGALRDPARAGAALRALAERIPTQRRHRSRLVPLPAGLVADDLSHSTLSRVLRDDGRLQFGTLGSGNHFVELQADEDERLWLMIHSGSRAMGQAVKAHHLARAEVRSSSLWALDADSPNGQAYLNDVAWCRRYAHANRAAIVADAVQVIQDILNARQVERTTIACDHNHVQREFHFGHSLFVHRKGAMPAGENVVGAIPGSMGTLSFHVEGRGCAESLQSSAHGAGRTLSRHAARDRFSASDLRAQMDGVWFDPRLKDELREESPRAYKDIRAVMRAQPELTKIVRQLRPLLVYKGR